MVILIRGTSGCGARAIINIWGASRGLARALAAVALILCAAGTALAAPTVTGLRFGVHPSATRLVLDISARVDYRIWTLSDPYRLIVELPAVGWQVGSSVALPRNGLVSAYRSGVEKAGGTRLVVELASPAVVRKAFMIDPTGGHAFRLVVDIEQVSAANYKSAAKRQNKITWSKGGGKLKPADKPKQRKKNEKRVVVLDPGHGGEDPGAKGSRGTLEKEITLAMARVLKKELEGTGRYRVVFTRKADIFIRLRDRIAIARKADADLFVSLHADSIRKKHIRGASVYTLSETASDDEAAALAAKENKADIIGGVDLTDEDTQVANILIDLAQRETMNLSARFANILIKELSRDLSLLRKTHRFAGFAVLKAPDVASVLVELGYLSNRTDERLLRTPAHRAKVAKAVVRAIDKYFALTAKLTRS